MNPESLLMSISVGPIAYRNGKFIPASELAVAVFDSGFVLGVTVTEQMRTFGGKLFRLAEHLDRCQRSLDIIGLRLPYDNVQLLAAAERLVAENHPLLEKGDDLGLCLFATPGPYPTMAPPGEAEPTVAMHTFPMPFRLFADTYRTGQRLSVTDVPQIPVATLPRELKCRSRMHYFLADQEALRRDANSRALMLDADGSVLESTTANILIYRREEGLVSPPRQRILPGISVAATLEIASRLGIPHTHRELSVDEFAAADEAFLTSTSVCILPVVALDGRPIGNGKAGKVFEQLLAGWGDLVGVEIAEQAERFSKR